MAWIAALRYRGPTALILSRQALPELAGTNVAYDQGIGKGAYIVKRESDLNLIYTACNRLGTLSRNRCRSRT